jgi:lipoprotein-anchoring transpeptidase ErfK/SrfK
MYQVYIRATDQYGHSTVQGWNDFAVNYQRILISLSQQKLWAYDGNQLFLSSLVTTGNRALPTPTGVFHILGKFHPFTFRSPWPKSSPFYYPPSPTQWAMLFREGGYFIHDAPWRSAFGPGTNAQLGKPGQNYTGTHGCVNVPSDVARRLFAWAQIGTAVQIVN